MPQFTVAETFTNAPVNLISGIGDMLITDQGGNRMLYTATRAGGGVLAFDIDAGMVLVDTVTVGGSSQLPVAPTLDRIEARDRSYLVISGTNQTTLLSNQIQDTGLLGQIFRPTGGPVGVISAQTLVTIGEATYFYAARANDGSVLAYGMAADGTLTLLQDLPLCPDLQGVAIAEMVELQVGPSRFLAVASPSTDQITLLRINGNGGLTPVATLGAAEGLGIADPTGLVPLVLNGHSYVLVASGSSSSLTVLEIAADGRMTAVDHVVDTLATRFQGAQTLAATVVDGRAYILTGGGDGGLELFTLLADGRLVSVAQQLQLPGLALDAIGAIALNVTGTRLEVFVGGEGAGITRLTLDLSGFATPLLGGAGNDTLTGGGGHDLIQGGAGADMLYGGTGEDILQDGAGSDALWGGAGADVFVLVRDGQTDTIRDFQPGLDRIDLSALGVFDASALQIAATTWGATITFRGEVLNVYSANGLPLTALQLRQAGLFDLWHVDYPLQNSSGEVIGSDRGDYLSGNPYNDLVFRGGAGDDTMVGGAGTDLFDGGAGTDLVTYDSATGAVRADLMTAANAQGFAREDIYVSIENLRGSNFADTLSGDNGTNAIWGADGNDQLYGRNGNDSLVGGAGNDTLFGGVGADVLNGESGRDRAQYSDATSGLRVDFLNVATNTGIAAGDRYSGIEDLFGSNYSDVLLGDNGSNVIWGANGNDQLYGRNGNDTLYGGAGDDTLIGGAGGDLLTGDAGRDRVLYSDATGGVRADLLTPGTNSGYAAGDRYSGIEDLFGSNYSDVLLGDNGGNVIWGANGNDQLHGRGGNDTLYGGAGGDTLIGGAGADLLNGEAGRDRADYSDATGGVRADLQTPGTNTGFAAGDRYIGIEDLGGSSFSDQLYGDAAANAIGGAGGNDLIVGRNGNDSLLGGAGNDTLLGGAGADLLNGEAGRDRVQYTDATGSLRADLQMPGTNTGFAAGDRYAGIEDLCGSNFLDHLFGDAAANAIWGVDGNDRLYGRNGNDTLYGGAGNDVLIGGAGVDVLNGGAGRDRAEYTDATAGLRVDLRNPDFNTGFAARDRYVGIEDLCGSNYSDQLYGDAGGNMILGAGGNDLIVGRFGNDSLLGGAGNDTLIGGGGADVLNGEAGRDRVQYSDATGGLRADLQMPGTNTGYAAGDRYAGIEDLGGSNFSDQLFGDRGANVIWGAGGNDLIVGRNGNDSLFGGAGNDTLLGGAGADLLNGEAGRDRVQYTDATGSLRADLQMPGTNTGFAAGDRYAGIEDLCGSNFSDHLFGNAGANAIWGGAGNDRLYGRFGNDTLYGGAGADIFVFNTPPGRGNIDRIGDFNAAADAIWLENAIFRGLQAGTLPDRAFTIGTAATNAAQRIIYDRGTGRLFFDADGAGGAAQVQFAVLAPGTALSAADFLIF